MKAMIHGGMFVLVLFGLLVLSVSPVRAAFCHWDNGKIEYAGLNPATNQAYFKFEGKVAACADPCDGEFAEHWCIDMGLPAAKSLYATVLAAKALGKRIDMRAACDCNVSDRLVIADD